MDPYVTAPWRRPSGNNSPTPYPGSPSITPPFGIPTANNANNSSPRFAPTSPTPFFDANTPYVTSPRTSTTKPPSPLAFVNNNYTTTQSQQQQPCYSPVASPRNSIILPSSPPIPNFPTSPNDGGGAGGCCGGGEVLMQTTPPPPPPPPMPQPGNAAPWRVNRTASGNDNNNDNNNDNSSGSSCAPALPPLGPGSLFDTLVFTPKPPPPSSSHQSSAASSAINSNNSCSPAKQYEHLPACLQSSLLKDKKPFTYTPGGIDLSEIRSPRMAKRLHYNQRDPPGNLAKIIIPPSPLAMADIGAPGSAAGGGVTSPPPPPETYPQTRVQILPTGAGNLMQQPRMMQVLPTQHYQQQQQQQPSLPSSTESPQHRRSRSEDAQDGFVPYYKEQRPQSRSFRLLQVMTDTTSGEADDGGEAGAADVGGQRLPVRTESDEMKFRGVRRNPIPSRAFQTLQRMTGDDEDDANYNYSAPVVNNNSSSNNNNNAYYNSQQQQQPANEGINSELRYRGAHIPSRSFRLLQEMTGGSDDDVVSPVSSASSSRSGTLPRSAKKTTSLSMQVQTSNLQALSLDLPPSQQKAEAEPRKYTGGNIPSRSFRMLQEMTGGYEDIDFFSPPMQGTVPASNGTCPSSSKQAEAEPRMYMGGNIPSRSFRLLQAMTDPDGDNQGVYVPYVKAGNKASGM